MRWFHGKIKRVVREFAWWLFRATIDEYAGNNRHKPDKPTPKPTAHAEMPPLTSLPDVVRDPRKRSFPVATAQEFDVLRGAELQSGRFGLVFDELPWGGLNMGDWTALARLVVVTDNDVQSFAGWVPKHHASWAARNEWAHWRQDKREPTGRVWVAVAAPGRGDRRRSNFVRVR